MDAIASRLQGFVLPSPYYERDGVAIYHGDCLEIIGALEGVDAIVSDPPYGIGYVKGEGGKGIHRNGRRNIEAITGDDSPFDPSPFLGYRHVILWGANHYAQRLPHGRWIAWNKLGDKEPWDSFSDVEFAWQNGRGKDRMFSLLWKGLCQGLPGGKKERRHHPTQKPLRLMRWCMGLIPAAETILDPFMGSGTTLVAARAEGRRAIGIEVDERYCEIAARRLAQGVLF
jgi:site-specific DNA-methyltransferase (adenine-specific)/modification methylase